MLLGELVGVADVLISVNVEVCIGHIRKLKIKTTQFPNFPVSLFCNSEIYLH